MSKKVFKILFSSLLVVIFVLGDLLMLSKSNKLPTIMDFGFMISSSIIIFGLGYILLAPLITKEIYLEE